MVRPKLHPVEGPALQAAIAELRDLLGARLTTGASVLEQHGRDEGWHDPSPPDAVAFVTTTDEAVGVVDACRRHDVPLIPFGAGTSLEGHIAALDGGIAVDLSEMAQILEVNIEDLDCRVEAGVTREQLNERLRREGLFFPIDPGSNPTIGGMTATRASGTNAVRYGTMRENVLGVTAVLPNGSVARTGTRARKSSAGYDLTRLMVGSEGTLGVITEVALRLHGLPETIAGAVCSFATLDGAVRTVIELIQLGVRVARVELLDDVQVEACNRHSELSLPVSPLLLFEFHGSPATVAEEAGIVEHIAGEKGGIEFAWSSDDAERNRLWKARHDAYYACLALAPGRRAIPTDVCVPISRLADCVNDTKRDIEESGLVAPIVGHVGDGNFHVLILMDPNDPDELRDAQALHARMVRRALAVGGTCTGEHGIGYGKLPFMLDEHDDASLDAMRAIKQALDPTGFMNPGKLVPPA